MPVHQHRAAIASASMFQIWSLVLVFLAATNRDRVLFISSPSSEADRPQVPSNPVIDPSSTCWRGMCPREPVQLQFSHGMHTHGCTSEQARSHEQEA